MLGSAIPASKMAFPEPVSNDLDFLRSKTPALSDAMRGFFLIKAGDSQKELRSELERRELKPRSFARQR